MASNKEEWSDWNPIVEDFSNEYTNEEAPAPVPAPVVDAFEADRLARSARQQKYPYLVVKKNSHFMTINMLTTYFGDDHIHYLEYRPNSAVFFVYFKNITRFESGYSMLERYPLLIDCHRGRYRPQQKSALEKNDRGPPAKSGPTPSIEERTAVNLKARTISVSADSHKHPVITVFPLLTTSDYTAKGSLLAIHDPDRRYLHVKYEFALERHGLYMLTEDRMEHKCTVHFRSGRIRAIPFPSEEEIVKNKDLSFIDKMGVRRCVICKEWTDACCDYCHMPCYHEECLQAEAKEHMESCGTGKVLELADRVLRREYPKPKMPPSGTKVMITAFTQTDVCYVLSTELNNQVAYSSILNEVMVQGKAAARLENLPICGQMVLFKFETEINRALVLCVYDLRDIYVVCIDHGNIEVTRMEDLYECSPYLAGLPCYPVAVKLRGVPKSFMSPNVRSAMYTLAEDMVYKLKYSKSEYDYNRNIQIAVLAEVNKKGSVNSVIKFIIKPTLPSLDKPGLKESCLQHVSLPTGKSIDLVVMDNSMLKCGLIYCTLRDLALEVAKIRRDLQAYGESITNCSFYAPPINNLCVAKYKGKWCRGLSMELVGDGYPSILFIDYGNIVPIHVSDIRPYPPQFTFPVLTTELDLIGCPAEPTDEQVKRLEQYLSVGSTVTCSEIVRCQESNNYSVRFDALQKILGSK